MFDVSHDGEHITIRIKVSDIPNVIFEPIDILDENQFPEDVVRELVREEEDGFTLIHRILDSCIDNLMDDGCASFTPRENPYDEDEDESYEDSIYDGDIDDSGTDGETYDEGY
jgi:hypothetical protein